MIEKDGLGVTRPHFVAAGGPSWIRTSDLLIKSQLLYRLSYGPTLTGRLPSPASAGKAVGEMASSEAAADAPPGRDRSQRLEDEAAAGELRVWNCQTP